MPGVMAGAPMEVEWNADPRYLEGAPDAMVELYSEVEADIMADMARRISKYDFIIPAAEHQLRVLEEMGAEQAYILRKLAELTGRSEEELRQLFEAAGARPWSATGRTTAGPACTLRLSTRPRSSRRCSTRGFTRHRAFLPT